MALFSYLFKGDNSWKVSPLNKNDKVSNDMYVFATIQIKRAGFVKKNQNRSSSQYLSDPFSTKHKYTFLIKVWKQIKNRLVNFKITSLLQ